MTRQLPEGWTVTYIHERVQEGWAYAYPASNRIMVELPKKFDQVLGDNPRGGVTIAHIKDADGGTRAEAMAVCRHDAFNKRGDLVHGDVFSKKLGRAISLGRALKYLDAVGAAVRAA